MIDEASKQFCEIMEIIKIIQDARKQNRLQTQDQHQRIREIINKYLEHQINLRKCLEEEKEKIKKKEQQLENLEKDKGQKLSQYLQKIEQLQQESKNQKIRTEKFKAEIQQLKTQLESEKEQIQIIKHKLDQTQKKLIENQQQNKIIKGQKIVLQGLVGVFRILQQKNHELYKEVKIVQQDQAGLFEEVKKSSEQAIKKYYQIFYQQIYPNTELFNFKDNFTYDKVNKIAQLNQQPKFIFSKIISRDPLNPFEIVCFKIRVHNLNKPKHLIIGIVPIHFANQNWNVNGRSLAFDLQRKRVFMYRGKSYQSSSDYNEQVKNEQEYSKEFEDAEQPPQTPFDIGVQIRLNKKVTWSYNGKDQAQCTFFTDKEGKIYQQFNKQKEQNKAKAMFYVEIYMRNPKDRIQFLPKKG